MKKFLILSILFRFFTFNCIASNNKYRDIEDFSPSSSYSHVFYDMVVEEGKRTVSNSFSVVLPNSGESLSKNNFFVSSNPQNYLALYVESTRLDLSNISNFNQNNTFKGGVSLTEDSHVNLANYGPNTLRNYIDELYIEDSHLTLGGEQSYTIIQEMTCINGTLEFVYGNSFGDIKIDILNIFGNFPTISIRGNQRKLSFNCIIQHQRLFTVNKINFYPTNNEPCKTEIGPFNVIYYLSSNGPQIVHIPHQNYF